MRVALISLVFVLVTGSALADRPVTGRERSQLLSALEREGCSGGKMEFEDGTFEVGTPNVPMARRMSLNLTAPFG